MNLSFIGNGIGSFGPIILGLDEVHYPHNIFIELIFELGIFGLFHSIVILYYISFSYKYSIFGYIAIYYFINSQFSGDLAGNSSLYIALLTAILTKDHGVKIKL